MAVRFRKDVTAETVQDTARKLRHEAETSDSLSYEDSHKLMACARALEALLEETPDANA